MYHSISFEDLDGQYVSNTYDNWHLVSEIRPFFTPPEAQTNFINIPGRNGTLDISESLTGYPVYLDRKGSFEFLILNGYQSWITLYSDVAEKVHNKKLRAILDDEPGYYYEGRFYMDSWQSDHPRSKITIGYEVLPYKREIIKSNDDWLWDPFSFERGIIVKAIFAEISVQGSKMIEFTHFEYGDEPVCPTFIVTGGDLTVSYRNPMLGVTVTKSIPVGSSSFPEIMLVGPLCQFTFTGNGTVTLEFRRGKL